MTAVFNFLEETGTDHKGRFLGTIISNSDDFWSTEHDFIQWLFPLDEKSMAVPNSPVIREPEISWICKASKAQNSIDLSTERFKSFLEKNTEWHSAHDHNHLRVTRVLKSLKLLRNIDCARQFKYWVALQLGDKIDTINEKTKQYWRLM